MMARCSVTPLIDFAACGRFKVVSELAYLRAGADKHKVGCDFRRGLNPVA